MLQKKSTMFKELNNLYICHILEIYIYLWLIMSTIYNSGNENIVDMDDKCHIPQYSWRLQIQPIMKKNNTILQVIILYVSAIGRYEIYCKTYRLFSENLNQQLLIT